MLEAAHCKSLTKLNVNSQAQIEKAVNDNIIATFDENKVTQTSSQTYIIPLATV